MNSIIRYHPWQHVRKVMSRGAPLPISILHKKKEVKQPPPPPPKKCEKKPERKNKSTQNKHKKKPIGVIYF